MLLIALLYFNYLDEPFLFFTLLERISEYT
jgi:hypothetical protein